MGGRARRRKSGIDRLWHVGSRSALAIQSKFATISEMSTLRYEPDEKCPPLLLIGTAIQAVTLVLAMTILIVAITVRASGQEDGLLVWASFATLVVVGITMALQASKIGRFGGGHLIVCGVTPNYIAISIIALAEGGPSMLASLIVVSAVFYYAVATWLPLLRRIITPTVAGTVLMLIAALIIPFALKLIRDTPETAHPSTGTAVAAVTVFATIALALRSPSIVRPWAISIGIIAGCVALLHCRASTRFNLCCLRLGSASRTWIFQVWTLRPAGVFGRSCRFS